jgi:hypothetical protein
MRHVVFREFSKRFVYLIKGKQLGSITALNQCGFVYLAIHPTVE